MPAYVMGKVVSVTIGSTICHARGAVNRQVTMADVTNSCSNGYQEMEPGIRRASGTLEISAKHNTTPFINEGDSVTVQVVMTGGQDFSVPAIIESVNYSWTTVDKVTIEATWQSSGAFTVSA
jgi:hypothetical protein